MVGFGRSTKIKSPCPVAVNFSSLLSTFEYYNVFETIVFSTSVYPLVFVLITGALSVVII